MKPRKDSLHEAYTAQVFPPSGNGKIDVGRGDSSPGLYKVAGEDISLLSSTPSNYFFLLLSQISFL